MNTHDDCAMFKRRYYLVLLLVAVLVVGLVMLFNREREPEYGGKKLSEWVEEYAPLMRGSPSIVPNDLK